MGSKGYFLNNEVGLRNVDETRIDPAKETNGHLESLDTKTGEVQATPTQHTLLGRLKDLWDKLVELFNDGTAKIKLWDGNRIVETSLANELMIKPPSQPLFVAHFKGTSLNANIWDEAVLGSGTVSLSDGNLVLTTTTLDGDSAHVTNKQILNQIFSKINKFTSSILIPDHTIANNVRIWGLHNATEGVYFKLDSGILSVCLEKNSVVTCVNIDQYKPTDGNMHKYDILYRDDLVYFYIDDIIVHNVVGVTGHLFNDEEVKVYLKNYNVGTTAVESQLLCTGVGVFDESSSGTRIMGEDDDGAIKYVAVTQDGRLKVSQEPPSAPPETTEVAIIEYNSIAGTVDTDWVIPTGKTILIQRLAGGAEPANGSSIELYYDPDGTKTNLEIIDVIFSDGQSDQHVLNATYTGDGVAQIVLRRTGLANSSARLVFGRWEGYY